MAVWEMFTELYSVVEASLGRLGIDGSLILNEYWGNWEWECGLDFSGVRQGIEETGSESVDMILLAQEF